MFDIFFIQKTFSKTYTWSVLKNRFPLAKKASSVIEAQQMSLTDFLWIVYDDVVINEHFDFDYTPDKWSQHYIHAFKNDTHYDGICLISKNITITNKELQHRFFINKKEIDTQASIPKPYDQFEIDTYDEYLTALETSTTEMFWMSSKNICADNHLLNTFYISYHDSQLRKQNHAFVHQVDDQKLYNGLFLCSKYSVLSKKEIEYRHPVNRIEHKVLGSTKKSYDQFEIDTYDEYLTALETSTTEMFWMSSRNIVAKIPDIYFSHDQTYNRNINHAFVHQVDDQKLYNGLFLCSKHMPLSKNEIEYRHPVNRKEWDVVASTKKPYDQFEIDTYDEYLTALETSTTEMFWMSSRNIVAKIPDISFLHSNVYDRKQNHAFVHQVDDQSLYNGLFLCSKHMPLSKNEVEYRHPVNRKEWDVVGSTSKPYDQFEIDTYGEYLTALETSTTEMFWMSSRNITATIPDIYFDHSNMYDRKQNHAFVHQVDDQKLYNGLFLCSKYSVLSKNEIEYRHPVNRKEWDVIGSTSKPYNQFEIDTYDEYLTALETSTTEMFWMSSRNITATIPDIYFSHDQTYNRNINHAFVHQVDDQKLYNGLFLCSKYSVLSKNEIEYRHPVNRKEWNVIGSTKKNYEIFNAKTYDDYLNALKNSQTEMFWIIPNYANPSALFKFDTYFTHDNEFDRKINHTYLNGKYHDGIVLCSKRAKFSKREFDYKFIANKKDVNIVISTPRPYDIVFISYQEPKADDYYKQLISRFSRAKRIHGVKGIHQAHIAAAKSCSSEMFWVVDGDALINSNFNFDYQVPQWDKEIVHVWRSINPINDLVYGYGGVKLLPTELTLSMDVTKPDMTTSISSKFKAVKEISNITAFNTDPFSTWRSAFRECVKLSSRIIDRQKDRETESRLHTWCTVGIDRPFGKYAIDGANKGHYYGLQNKNNYQELAKVNNFDWLREQFDAANI